MILLVSQVRQRHQSVTSRTNFTQGKIYPKQIQTCVHSKEFLKWLLYSEMFSDYSETAIQFNLFQGFLPRTRKQMYHELCNSWILSTGKHISHIFASFLTKTKKKTNLISRLHSWKFKYKNKTQTRQPEIEVHFAPGAPLFRTFTSARDIGSNCYWKGRPDSTCLPPPDPAPTKFWKPGATEKC